MTAQLPKEPKRVANWLAGWVDYVFALTLVATRWLRPPTSRKSARPEAAGVVRDEHAPRWNDQAAKRETSTPVRVAEIGMVLASFFLGAQLLSGTPTVAAPDLSKLTLAPDSSGIGTRLVPATSGREVFVPNGTFVGVTAGAHAATPEVEEETEAALLAPLPGSEAAAAAIADSATPTAEPTQTPAPEPTVAAVPTAAPPTPEPTAVPAAPPAPSRVVNPALPDLYLTSEQLKAAALEAGWPVEVIPELEKVAWCESRYHTHAEYLGARGLMQVLPFWFDVAGLDFTMWADPVTNLKAALVAYNEHLRFTGDDPWSAWTCKP